MSLRLVLDTNVVLDMFLFRDRSADAVRRLLEDGRARCAVSERSLAELRHVLARPVWKLDEAGQSAILAAYAGYHDEATAPAAAAAALPLCSDPADQKFLELARDAGADYLVTKDKALLKLRRAKHGLEAFRILTPAQLALLTG